MTFFANIFWFLSNLPKYFNFFIKAKNISDTQEAILIKYIKKNKNTEFGKKNRFSSIKTIREFQNQVPISNYEDYQAYIKLIQNNLPNILTKEEVLILEPTSGSANASKLIPYTKKLKKEFQAGISAWLADMYLNNPSLFFLRSYWLITPNIKKQKEEKIGFKDDSEYLGFFSRLLISKILAAPNIVSQVTNQDSFFHITLLFLLKYKNLGIISIWSPTILSLYIDYFEKNRLQILKNLAHGKIDNLAIEKSIRNKIEKLLGTNKKRANEIADIFKQKANNKNELYKKIWPKLRIISCWTDGASEFFIKNIRNNFPHVQIIGKGLIATEAFISFPLTKTNGSVLAVNSHFFEFKDMRNDKICLAGDLEVNKKYKVIVTSGGGLYRYNLNDIIKIMGFYKSLPIVKFIQKDDNVCDLFGEKINESFIQELLLRIFEKQKIYPKFFLVAPEKFMDKIQYTLFIELAAERDLLDLQREFELGLLKNFHYKHCRNIGQLEPVKLFIIQSAGEKDFINFCIYRGQKMGDIKNKILDKSLGWTSVFKGKYYEYKK